jgi:hypothetical protein
MTEIPDDFERNNGMKCRLLHMVAEILMQQYGHLSKNKEEIVESKPGESNYPQ